jgi:hypothetical protein
MKNNSIEFLRAEVARLTAEIAEFKMLQQQAKLDSGLPIGENEKAEFARTNEKWELAQIERMQQIASENPSNRVGWMFGQNQNPTRIENHKNREQQ